jgi:hypothetical protein
MEQTPSWLMTKLRHQLPLRAKTIYACHAVSLLTKSTESGRPVQ